MFSFTYITQLYILDFNRFVSKHTYKIQFHRDECSGKFSVFYERTTFCFDCEWALAKVAPSYDDVLSIQFPFIWIAVLTKDKQLCRDVKKNLNKNDKVYFYFIFNKQARSNESEEKLPETI